MPVNAESLIVALVSNQAAKAQRPGMTKSYSEPSWEQQELRPTPKMSTGGRQRSNAAIAFHSLHGNKDLETTKFLVITLQYAKRTIWVPNCCGNRGCTRRSK